MAVNLALMQANGLFDHPESVAARERAEAAVADAESSALLAHCPTCGASRSSRFFSNGATTSVPQFVHATTSDVNVVLDKAVE